ncbi:GNAT family N-acetyltransferase [Paenibacillus sambharensis]|uniref:GNAT family N-acetyltransferase n=1 Tax=Paenibacillus sambharensis TaxID=1803190 RepID=A0A2W1LFL1_9BACL|nr:GNAT family N-acetyltransferase [Paenibacillus sambharensis]PZD97623.1 GNAT family N-acetyltransferase [Paenibacillus sambharensis]
MDIRYDDLTGPQIRALIGEHLKDMTVHSPPESIHALDIEGLKQPGVTFWSIWEGDELLGCGALKELDSSHGEIKSMRTASAHRRKGAARQILAHIMEEAVRRGYRRVSLETGSMEAFKAARNMYESFGFQYCPPFADYVEDPYSVFMTKEL